MQTKQEYIEKEISICEHFKESAQSRINYFNEEIERFKNLSDEEYEKILESKMEKEKIDKEDELDLEEKLLKIGVTLEEFDNMSFDELKNIDWSGKNLSELKDWVEKIKKADD